MITILPKHFYFLILCCLFHVLWGCKQEKEIITYDPTNVEIKILNEKGEPLAGALVRLYDNAAAYAASKLDGIEGNFSGKSLTDASGIVKFSDLNADKEYFILATFRDRARFLDLDNMDAQYEFNKYLSKGTDSKILIKLQPAKSVVSFFAPENLVSQLPIYLYIGDDSIGTITQSLSTPPTGQQSTGALSFRLSQGLQGFYAKSALGCVWSGSIRAKGTESFESLALEDCNAGSISFYVDEANAQHLPIKITINGNQVGTLNTYLSTTPTECFAKGAITVADDVGDIIYTAESMRSECVWTDKITIAKGSCQKIKLSPCK